MADAHWEGCQTTIIQRGDAEARSLYFQKKGLPAGCAVKGVLTGGGAAAALGARSRRRGVAASWSVICGRCIGGNAGPNL